MKKAMKISHYNVCVLRSLFSLTIVQILVILHNEILIKSVHPSSPAEVLVLVGTDLL